MVEQIAAANSWLNGYVWGGPMIGWLVFIYLGGIGSLHLVWDVADANREFFATIVARR